jgi:hypothetical protein
MVSCSHYKSKLFKNYMVSHNNDPKIRELESKKNGFVRKEHEAERQIHDVQQHISREEAELDRQKSKLLDLKVEQTREKASEAQIEVEIKTQEAKLDMEEKMRKSHP